MKILTMNLWHGLSPSNPLMFERLEPDERRKLREGIQIDLLKKIDPDVAFFQEVNPVTTRFHQLCDSLQRQGVFQPDLVGLKLFGYGLPLHLFSGLVILSRPAWPIKTVDTVSLSGQRSFVHSWASLQVKEERFAIFAETKQAGIGRILLINTHLHHGLEATESFTASFSRVMEQMDLSQSAQSELHERLMAGNERRSREVSVLLRHLSTIKDKFDLTVLGGDFNCEPEGEIGQRLRDLGFVDIWRSDHRTDPGYTFDREHNLANHILQDRFPLTFLVEDLSFSDKTREALEKAAREQERRPRRIDQLWVRTSGRLSSRSELVGYPDERGMAPSDHFGVLADLEIG